MLVATNKAVRGTNQARGLEPGADHRLPHPLVFAAWDNYTADRINMMFDLTNEQRGFKNEGWENYRQMVLKATPTRPEVNFQHAARQAYIGGASALIAAAAEQVDRRRWKAFDPKASGHHPTWRARPAQRGHSAGLPRRRRRLAGQPEPQPRELCDRSGVIRLIVSHHRSNPVIFQTCQRFAFIQPHRHQGDRRLFGRVSSSTTLKRLEPRQHFSHWAAARPGGTQQAVLAQKFVSPPTTAVSWPPVAVVDGPGLGSSGVRPRSARNGVWRMGSRSNRPLMEMPCRIGGEPSG